MKIPHKLEKDKYTFKVSEVNRLYNYKGAKCWGITDEEAKTIKINRRQHRDEKIDTFLHEIIHACSWVEGLDLSEKQVTRLSTRLTQVFKQNKLKICH
jgi:hypothetical protein